MIINKIIKVIICLFLITIGFDTLISQDVVSPPALPIVIGNPIIQRTQSKFVLGWNWGSPCRTLDSALKMNAYHNFPFGSSDVAPNIMVVALPGDGDQKIIGARKDNRLSNALSIHLKPTLSINQDGTLIYSSVDNSQSIFGFKTRNYGSSPSTGVNAYKYVLNKTTTNTRVNVLKDIYDGK